MKERLFSIPFDLLLTAGSLGRPPLDAGAAEQVPVHGEKAPAKAVPSDSPPSQTLTIRSAKQLKSSASAEWPVVTARWVSETQDLGPIIPLGAIEIFLIESPGDAGQMRWTEVVGPLSFESEPPDGATALRIELPDGSTVTLANRTLQSFPAHLPPPHVEHIGAADARFVVPVFSERFADRGNFIAKVRGLHEWILGQPPFCREEVGKHFALRAHFWASDPDSGLFDTRDSRNENERLFHGDLDIAKRLLSRYIGRAPVSLILINSPLRGGAGGRPRHPAWCSIASAPGEAWEAVCLHELGHAFGLADEYVDIERAGERFEGREPNVAADPRPSQTPWRALATLPDTPAPSYSSQTEEASPPGAIGTFRGSRYRNDLYRPAHTCLMKVTKSKTEFCLVCQAHIAEMISS